MFKSIFESNKEKFWKDYSSKEIVARYKKLLKEASPRERQNVKEDFVNHIVNGEPYIMYEYQAPVTGFYQTQTFYSDMSYSEGCISIRA